MDLIRRRSFSVGLLLCAVAATVAAFGLGHSWIRQAPSIDFESASVELRTGAIDQSHALLSGSGSGSGRRIESLESNATAALRGYWLAVGSSVDDGTFVLDFSDRGPAAAVAIERAALGAYESGRTIERDGPFRLRIDGPPPPPLTNAPTEERIAALAAVIEVAGDVDGSLATVPSVRASELLELAVSLDLEPSEETIGDETEVRLLHVSDRAVVSTWPVACVDRVPLIGGRGCDGPANLLAFAEPETRTIDAWLAATTGPLDRSEPHWLDSDQGGVRWTNGEAQQYRDTQVARTEQGIVMTAAALAEPRVDRAPFDSGMVFSSETVGWGRIEVDVVVPSGNGLWPAVWLLGADACEAPGVCSGYDTPRYHEIDLLETAGRSTLSTTVHWFDDRLRSRSTETDTPELVDGSVHTIALDRRPGLLVWSLDGVEVDRVEGRAAADVGPHRSGQMRLIANLAVGGSFAGGVALGPDSGWWGSSIVPADYPDLGWSSASLVMTEARFTPLYSLALGR